MYAAQTFFNLYESHCILGFLLDHLIDNLIIYVIFLLIVQILFHKICLLIGNHNHLIVHLIVYLKDIQLIPLITNDSTNIPLIFLIIYPIVHQTVHVFSHLV